MNDDSTKKPNEPSAASLEEMPEIYEPRFRVGPDAATIPGVAWVEIVAISAEAGSFSGLAAYHLVSR
jgi:hypothetical protein